jgi:uncharacterized protein (TIGR02145 family)
MKKIVKFYKMNVQRVLLSFSLIVLTTILRSQSMENITISNQIWMKLNLKIDEFRNGEKIQQAKTHKQWEKAEKKGRPAWCYYNFDSRNEEKYGKLYNWYAVSDTRGLAPLGYHIPSYPEMQLLCKNLGGEIVSGVMLKTNMDWFENGNGSNQSGFSGLPGGYYWNGNFEDCGKSGIWWCATEYEKNNKMAYSMGVYHSVSHSNFNVLNKGNGCSIRLVKD